MNTNQPIASDKTPVGPGGTTYRCGTLTYTKAGLAALFAWLLWGDFCYTMMQAVVPSLVPLKLNALGCPNWLMGMIMTTIPGILGIVVGPWVSFKSDRHRSKWGRRIPFIIWTLPFLCVSLALLGWSDSISGFLHAHSTFLRQFAPATLTIAVIALFLAVFQFFNAFVNSVFWYLFNDVVPPQFIARFLGVFRIVGTGAGALYSYFAFQYAETNMREIFTGAAMLYFLGFGIVCFMVREGEYPPFKAETGEDNKRIGGLRVFFKECFTNKFYWIIFLFTIFQNAGTSSMGTFTVFFFKDMGLSLAQIGKLGAIGGIAGLLAMYLAAIFIDRWHPLRVLAYSCVFAFLGYSMSLVWLFVTVPANFFFWLSLGGGLISVFQSALLGGCFMPFYMKVFPQSRFGQFCSAMSMLSTFVAIGAGMLAGLFIDLMKYLCHGSDFAYRFIYLWFSVGAVIYTILIIMAYREWYRLGGDAHFHPPAPWDPKGIEEMPIVPTVGPQSRWLDVTLKLFNAIMYLSVFGIPFLMCWMYHKHAMVALTWHACLLLPLSLIAWVYWMIVEKGIRRDIARARNNEPLHNGIPHHGVLIITAIKFLLASGIWICQVVVTVNLNMESGAIVFTAANVITNFILIASVQLICRIERGFSVQVDAEPMAIP
jgi:MFS family permease